MVCWYKGNPLLNETLNGDNSSSLILTQNDDPIQTKLLWNFIDNKQNIEVKILLFFFFIIIFFIKRCFSK